MTYFDKYPDELVSWYGGDGNAVSRFWHSVTGPAHVRDAEIKNYAKRVSYFTGTNEAELQKRVWAVIARIEHKAAAYLQHISMMIAAVGLVLVTFADKGIEKSILLFEMLGYLVTAIVCIRCLYHAPVVALADDSTLAMGSQGGNIQELSVGISELILRERWLSFATKGIWILTILFGLTLFGHVFLA